jgi:hypothetical protein
MTLFNVVVLTGGVTLKAALLTWHDRRKCHARDTIITVKPVRIS